MLWAEVVSGVIRGCEPLLVPMLCSCNNGAPDSLTTYIIPAAAEAARAATLICGWMGCSKKGCEVANKWITGNIIAHIEDPAQANAGARAVTLRQGATLVAVFRSTQPDAVKLQDVDLAWEVDEYFCQFYVTEVAGDALGNIYTRPLCSP